MKPSGSSGLLFQRYKPYANLPGELCSIIIRYAGKKKCDMGNTAADNDLSRLIIKIEKGTRTAGYSACANVSGPVVSRVAI